jgi:hypothetical protein
LAFEPGRHLTGFVTTTGRQRTNRVTGSIECRVAVTHDKNLHIAPLLLTRITGVNYPRKDQKGRKPDGRALCLIHLMNETLFFTLMA